METDKLHTIWKKIDSEIHLKPISELNKSLAAKTRKTMNNFLFFLGVDIIVCTGVIIFLTITALNRLDDIIYLANNSALCLITLTSLIVSVWSYYKLQNNKLNLSLKDWLGERIELLSQWLLGKSSKIYIFLLPVLLVMMNLSIHVYYEYKPFIEVLKDRESLPGLTVGFLVGLIVSIYAVKKIRRHQLLNLKFLKELYDQLSDENK